MLATSLFIPIFLLFRQIPHEAVSNHVILCGKYIRPILCLASCLQWILSHFIFCVGWTIIFISSIAILKILFAPPYTHQRRLVDFCSHGVEHGHSTACATISSATISFSPSDYPSATTKRLSKHKRDSYSEHLRARHTSNLHGSLFNYHMGIHHPFLKRSYQHATTVNSWFLLRKLRLANAGFVDLRTLRHSMFTTYNIVIIVLLFF